MFRKGHLIKTFTLFLAWTVACISFYALGWYLYYFQRHLIPFIPNVTGLNTSKLSGHIILNFFLARLTNLGKMVLVFLMPKYFGLRKGLSACLLLLGQSCIMLAFVCKDQVGAVLVIYLVAYLLAQTSMS